MKSPRHKPGAVATGYYYRPTTGYYRLLPATANLQKPYVFNPGRLAWGVIAGRFAAENVETPAAGRKGLLYISRLIA